MQKEDGQVQAHGWSLPSKSKVGEEGMGGRERGREFAIITISKFLFFI
jgi:hypothetical protein